MKIYTYIVIFLMGVAHASPLVVAHRGASHSAPENTLSAFKLAWSEGADAIEADFHLTKDNQVVCIHDEDTEFVSRTRPALIVKSSNLADLKKVDVGSLRGTKWEGEKIPTIDEVLAIVPDSKKIFIEIKSDQRTVPHVIKAIKRQGLKEEQVVIISFRSEVLKRVESMEPSLKTLLLVKFRKFGNFYTPSRKELIQLGRKSKIDGFSCPLRNHISRKYVASIKSQGFEFHAYTIDDTSHAQYLKGIGVDSITTNHPGKIKKATESK